MSNLRRNGNTAFLWIAAMYVIAFGGGIYLALR